MTAVPSYEALEIRARAVVEQAKVSGVMIATAESCTGGLIAGFLTEIPGSSAVVDRGFVTYSNAAKAECLGIEPSLIERHGAVSEEVARAMAAGAIAHSGANATVAVTGIAGPGGGNAEKPVGLVHLAAASGQKVVHRRMEFGDIGRRDVRLLSVATALDLLSEVLGEAKA